MIKCYPIPGIVRSLPLVQREYHISTHYLRYIIIVHLLTGESINCDCPVTAPRYAVANPTLNPIEKRHRCTALGGSQVSALNASDESNSDY